MGNSNANASNHEVNESSNQSKQSLSSEPEKAIDVSIHLVTEIAMNDFEKVASIRKEATNDHIVEEVEGKVLSVLLESTNDNKLNEVEKVSLIREELKNDHKIEQVSSTSTESTEGHITKKIKCVDTIKKRSNSSTSDKTPVSCDQSLLSKKTVGHRSQSSGNKLQKSTEKMTDFENKTSKVLNISNILTWSQYATLYISNFSGSKMDTPYNPSEVLNDKISIQQADITRISADTIVNAANSSLRGGGGVDGAIHDAAGPELLKECISLKGCATGDAKITKGYKLPAKNVIHTVGPIGEKPKALISCYIQCLNLAKYNNCKTIVFPCISTGIYGYPNENATRIALGETRTWLENQNNSNMIDRIVFCVFLKKDLVLYEKWLPYYFPLIPSKE